MGRSQPSLGLAPPPRRKDARAKAARLTAHKTIPGLLVGNARARKGVESSELILDASAVDAGISSKGTESRKHRRDAREKVKIRVVEGDTLVVARALSQASSGGIDDGKSSRLKSNVAVLNMASPLLPGGGFLNGATAQEESLCNRTTLYPALKDEFYRLPEVGAIWTEDVLVFRDHTGKDLGKGDRWWVDVISAAMLRFPDVEGIDNDKKYAGQKDRDTASRQIKCLMDILRAKGVEKCVLGAWGCGAYGNPVVEIARAFNKVILGDGRDSKVPDWASLKEIVFAIKEDKLASDFAKHFGNGLEVERQAHGGNQTSKESDDGDTAGLRELEDKIKELDLRIDQSKNPSLKTTLENIRVQLTSQLERKRSDNTPAGESDEATSEDEDEDDGISGTDSA
ncbi:uncharacterized protein PV06_07116 [Exophiala oligosperma]|uniref:Microbial-type PARG catalytic domain-containing protein n=1 Tax=Exophiala oligosperma TaxID=215243 RepID=A0A0D2BVW8_9EURO|nr:uncharacterized protein PV06_07116 [Exophiala oligosperma]KIW41567.1 hypothetical protein PV06_07116 [Exophiala oligosperma]